MLAKMDKCLLLATMLLQTLSFKRISGLSPSYFQSLIVTPCFKKGIVIFVSYN